MDEAYHQCRRFCSCSVVVWLVFRIVEQNSNIRATSINNKVMRRNDDIKLVIVRINIKKNEKQSNKIKKINLKKELLE